MVYGFANQSEGYAKIRSEIGHGTMVSLYLPRHHGVAKTEVAEFERSLDPRVHLNECVLLVEDEPGIREVLAEVLTDLGLEVCVAEDGLAGLAILESGRALNLLITDIGLPGMNGRTLADRARALYPDLPILLMTGYAENAVLTNGFLGPGMEMITKPFALTVLTEKVQTILRPE
jgi:CheY-like chemotaxis protein